MHLYLNYLRIESPKMHSFFRHACYSWVGCFLYSLLFSLLFTEKKFKRLSSNKKSSVITR